MYFPKFYHLLNTLLPDFTSLSPFFRRFISSILVVAQFATVLPARAADGKEDSEAGSSFAYHRFPESERRDPPQIYHRSSEYKSARPLENLVREDPEAKFPEAQGNIVPPGDEIPHEDCCNSSCCNTLRSNRLYKGILEFGRNTLVGATLGFLAHVGAAVCQSGEASENFMWTAGACAGASAALTLFFDLVKSCACKKEAEESEIQEPFLSSTSHINHNLLEVGEGKRQDSDAEQQPSHPNQGSYDYQPLPDQPFQSHQRTHRGVRAEPDMFTGVCRTLQKNKLYALVFVEGLFKGGVLTGFLPHLMVDLFTTGGFAGTLSESGAKAIFPGALFKGAWMMLQETSCYIKLKNKITYHVATKFAGGFLSGAVGGWAVPLVIAASGGLLRDELFNDVFLKGLWTAVPGAIGGGLRAIEIPQQHIVSTCVQALIIGLCCGVIGGSVDLIKVFSESDIIDAGVIKRPCVNATSFDDFDTLRNVLDRAVSTWRFPFFGELLTGAFLIMLMPLMLYNGDSKPTDKIFHLQKILCKTIHCLSITAMCIGIIGRQSEGEWEAAGLAGGVILLTEGIVGGMNAWFDNESKVSLASRLTITGAILSIFLKEIAISNWTARLVGCGSYLGLQLSGLLLKHCCAGCNVCAKRNAQHPVADDSGAENPIPAWDFNMELWEYLGFENLRQTTVAGFIFIGLTTRLCD